MRHGQSRASVRYTEDSACLRSIPTSTALSVRSSSQSIRSSAKARLSGWPQNSPIRSTPSKSGEHEDVDQLGAGSGSERIETLT
jgi:hypothetical protein